MRRFGEPKVIIVGHPGSPLRMIEKIQDTLQRDWEKGHYLVPNGSPLGLLAAGYIFATMNIGDINTLLWNRSELKYELFRWEFSSSLN